MENLKLYLNPNPTKTHFYISFYLLLAMHIAGALGLYFSFTRTLFEFLVPFNLLNTFLILLYFHQDWTKSFLLFLFITYIVGFGIEVLGVQTKMIFGNYWYETTLGLKFFDVPLTMGLNWVVLVYTSGMLIENFFSKFHFIFKASLGASLMVCLDIFIEPIAIKHLFWNWANEEIPLQNYIVWYIVAFVLLLVFYNSKFQKKNPLARYIFLIQLLFFVLLNTLYLL